MDWTGGLEWWTDLRNNFFLHSNDTHSPVGLCGGSAGSVHFWFSPIPMILGMKRVVRNSIFKFFENWKLNSVLNSIFDFQFCWLDLAHHSIHFSWIKR